MPLRRLLVILDVLLEIFPVDGSTQEQTLEFVTSAACQDLELVFLAYAGGSN